MRLQDQLDGLVDALGVGLRAAPTDQLEATAKVAPEEQPAPQAVALEVEHERREQHRGGLLGDRARDLPPVRPRLEVERLGRILDAVHLNAEVRHLRPVCPVT